MDEVNIHVPQTLEAKAEFMELMCVEKNIVSGQSSRPIMGVVQDALVGSYLMTQGWVNVERGRFFDICTRAKLDISRFSHIEKVYSLAYPDVPLRADGVHPYLYTGRGLLSMVFPQTFHYTLNNKAYSIEPMLKIRQGVIIEGSIDKSAAGPKAGAVHHYMSSKNALNFLTLIQHTVNAWIMGEGISVGVEDCIPKEYNSSGMIPQAADHIEKCYLRAQVAESTQSNPRIAEIKVTSALNAARDIGQRIAKESIPSTNRFLPLIYSGSKGSLNNTTQIIAGLGQQSVGGDRLEETCLGGGRTLPHYDPETWTAEQKYESRGFVRHSFFCGLNPQEFWSHASGSREGIINTAVSTAKTGYCQRKITEMLKNITVYHDQTVRDMSGRIVQFVYGGDGMSPNKQHRMDGGMGLHIGTTIERLNAQHEIDSFNTLDEEATETKKVESIKDIFRKTHLLSIVVEPTASSTDDLSPINSGYGSDSGADTPDSVGTPGSVEYDYDD